MAEEQEWANLLAEIFDKLTQKHASITYDFENLEMQGKVEKEGNIVNERIFCFSINFMKIHQKGLS